MPATIREEPMHPFRDMTLCVLTFSLAGVDISSGQERDRSRIPDQYKWDLRPIYADDAAWRRAKDSLVAQIPKVEQYRSRLSESPGVLLECLEYLSGLGKEYARLYTYAQLKSDIDTRDASYLAMQQEIAQAGSEFAAKSSFIQPEILRMDRSTIDAFVAKEPGLTIYRHSLDDILRRKAHTGTESEEKIIADASLMADGPGNIYSIFSNADFPFPDITLSDGRKVRLDKAAFNLYRALPGVGDRKRVFDAYMGKLNDYRRTFGTELYSEVKKNMFFMRARKYGSCLENALDGNNIPASVYRSLIENVNANLATFHRYLRLRKRMLGVDTLHYYDLYAPVVASVDLQYSVEEAEKNILQSLAPLGPEYMEVARRALTERWVDVYPNTGKMAGAYSNGSAYDVHPYMLLNYNGKYDDMSTLAHELGHTMHSYLSNRSQLYVNAHYSIFVAEVASTLNEALLMDFLLKTIKDDATRLSLLGNYLDGVKGTLFRQVQFAEFELRIHEIAERGESLTGETLNALYEEIARKYYGHAAGVCTVDDNIAAEWANVPHFYYNFYVYQYATSLTASSAISEQILAGDAAATKRYLELLSAGGSDYPIELLKKAGVDMTTAKPFDLMMKKVNRVMDEVEKILERTEK